MNRWVGREIGRWIGEATKNNAMRAQWEKGCANTQPEDRPTGHSE